MIKKLLLLITGVLYLSSCAATKDVDIQTSERMSYNYNEKNYQFLEKNIKINDPNNRWQTPDFDLGNIVTRAVNNELKKRGLKHSNTQADIIISYGIDINMAARKLKLFGSEEKGYFIDTPKGALTIIISNKKTNETLWIAWAKAQYKQLEKLDAKKRIEYAIAEMFIKFPN